MDDTPAFNTRDIETRFVNRFSSSLIALAETLRNQKMPEKLIIIPAEKGQQLPLKLSYEANSAKAAQLQLTEYIEQTNSYIVNELELNLRESLQQKTIALTNLLTVQEQIAQEQKDLRIAQIKEALKIVEAAQISQPQGNQGDNVNQDTLFLLGSEALSAMVKRESMRPLNYSEDYFRIRQQFLAIRDIKSNKIDSISTYRYVLKPTLPVNTDDTKKIIVLSFGSLLGGMIGCVILFVRNVIIKYKEPH